MRRSRLLPVLPLLILVVVALVQMGVAHTTTLSHWKLGGFGMFSTADSPGFRVLRIELETENGTYLVPGPAGSEWTRVWPRASVLQADARRAVCGAWTLTPLDAIDQVDFPDRYWESFYSTPFVLDQTQARGFATEAVSAEARSARPVVEAARASVWWIRMGPEAEDGKRNVVPQLVASETVTAEAAGC